MATQENLNYMLLRAAIQKKTDIVKYLLDQGADPTNNDSEALCSVINSGNLDIIEMLVRAGANIHARNEYPLREASEKGDLEIIDYLITEGAIVNVVEDFPWEWRPTESRLYILNLLIEGGYDSCIHFQRALYLSSATGDLAAFQYCVEKGANVYENDNLAIRYVIENGHSEIIEYLVESNLLD
jgi:ankyrin repeat protein